MSGPALWQGLTFWNLPGVLEPVRTVSALRLAASYALDAVYLFTFTVAALGYGMVAVRLLLRTPLEALERFLIAEGLGLGTLALLTLCLGASAGVSPGLAFLLIGLGLAVTAVELVRWLNKRPLGSPEVPNFLASLSLLETALSGILIFSAAVHIVGALGPETFYDSLVYHLAAPNTYILRGAIGKIDGIAHSHFPQNMEMLYMLGLLLRGERLAKLIQLWTMFLTLAAIYGIGRTACSRRTALTACALFSVVPVTAIAAWHTGTEIGVSFWSLMGIWSLIRGFYARTDSRTAGACPRWLMASGIFHGLAMGTKYTALWNSAACAILLFWWLKTDTGMPKGLRLRLAAIWCLAAFAFLSPWLVKNVVLTGNPVYPFLRPLFGPQGLYPLTDELSATARGHFWYGGLFSWKTWLIMPWKLFTEGRSPYSFIGPTFIAFVPLLIRFRKSVFPFGWILAAFVLEYVAWSASSSMVRFFIPSLSLFCLYTAHHITLLEKDFSPWTPWLVFPVLLWNLAWNGSMLNEKQIPRVVFGYESEDAFMSRPHLGYSGSMHEIAGQIDRDLPLNARILVVGDSRSSFLKRDAHACTLFDKSKLLSEIEISGSEKALFSRLRAQGFTHLLANYPETLRLRVKQLQALDDRELRLLSRFWRGYLRLVKRTDQDVALYELRSPEGPIPPSRSPADLPEIVRIALGDNPRFLSLGTRSRARFLMSLAN